MNYGLHHANFGVHCGIDQPRPLTHNLIVAHLCMVKAMLNAEYCYFQKTRVLLGLYNSRLNHIPVLK